MKVEHKYKNQKNGDANNNKILLIISFTYLPLTYLMLMNSSKNINREKKRLHPDK